MRARPLQRGGSAVPPPTAAPERLPRPLAALHAPLELDSPAVFLVGIASAPAPATVPLPTMRTKLLRGHGALRRVVLLPGTLGRLSVIRRGLSCL